MSASARAHHVDQRANERTAGARTLDGKALAAQIHAETTREFEALTAESGSAALDTREIIEALDPLKDLDAVERLGHGDVPVCMAKTQSSLSHDPALKGRPAGWRLPIRDARLFAGSGFVTAYCGNMMMMLGLPTRRAGEDVDIDESGRIVGLFQASAQQSWGRQPPRATSKASATTMPTAAPAMA